VDTGPAPVAPPEIKLVKSQAIDFQCFAPGADSKTLIIVQKKDPKNALAKGNYLYQVGKFDANDFQAEWYDEYSLKVKGLTPGGRQVLVTYGATLAIRDGATGAAVRELKAKGISGEIEKLAFAGNGTRVAVAGDGTAVDVWDMTNWEPIASCECKNPYAIALSPDGSLLTAFSQPAEGTEWKLTRWDLKSGKESGSGMIKMDKIEQLKRSRCAVTPDGQTVVWIGDDDKLRADTKGTQRILASDYFGSSILGISSDSKTLCSLGWTRSAPDKDGRSSAQTRAAIIDLATGTIRHQLPLPRDPGDAVVTPNLRYLALYFGGQLVPGEGSNLLRVYEVPE